jgi:hypothetical protein
MSKSIKEYRNQIQAEDVKEILKKYDVEPVSENASMIIYPTVCHNLDHNHASHKLYYYKKDNIFKCYTECDEVFDLFQLIIKMDNLRGKQTSLREALGKAGIDTVQPIDENEYYSVRKQLSYLHSMNDKEELEIVDMTVYSKAILDKYVFDLEYLRPWIQEGIGPTTLTKYGIKFDMTESAIVIPYFNLEKDLVGIRGRFLAEGARAKYMPMKHDGNYLSHPTSQILYGLNVNKEAISRIGTVVLFEGEKSVMKMDTIYGADNISVAVSGKNISKTHIQMLVELGVKEVIIAFDREYDSINELNKKLEEYRRITKQMKHFFNISIMIDKEFTLPFKESPIDRGKDVFEKLLATRVFI